MAPRRGGSPRRVLSVRRYERERELRVDGTDGGPRQFDSAQHVSQAHASVGHGNARRPEQGPSQHRDERNYPAVAAEFTDSSLNDRQGNGSRSNHSDKDRQYLPESGTKSDGFAHLPIVACVRQRETQVTS
jgi:hypothetical protein